MLKNLWTGLNLIGTSLLIGICSMQIFLSITDEEYHGFPAITQCRICDKTVWVWQDYQRKNYIIKTNFFSIDASGLVHEKHLGVPEVKINIEID